MLSFTLRQWHKYVLLYVSILLLCFLYGGWSSSIPSDWKRPDAGPITGNGEAIVSDWFAHFDVYLPAAKTMGEVLGEDASILVFAKTPFRFGFNDVIDAMDIYNKEVRHPDLFMSAIRSTDLYPGEPGKMIELVLFGTCEIDMRIWSDELLLAWDARPADQKFNVVCIAHHQRDYNWQGAITPWAARGAIRILPIASHVGRAFRERFNELADSSDPMLKNAMYEYIPIDVHVPVLQLPEYGQRRRANSLSRAVIQGAFRQDDRDYMHTFADLLYELKLDPGAWGYQPLYRDMEMYKPLIDSPDEPFTLHLIGGEGHLDIPKALSNVVIVHDGLDYLYFYAFMQSMDVILPAFANNDYYNYLATSTMAMAVQCNVPILATHRIRKAYGYIDDDRVTITRPHALREIAAIGALRKGHLPTPLLEDPTTSGLHADMAMYTGRFLDDVDAMLRSGWRRSRKDFETFKRDLRIQNRRAIERALDWLPGEI